MLTRVLRLNSSVQLFIFLFPPGPPHLCSNSSAYNILSLGLRNFGSINAASMPEDRNFESNHAYMPDIMYCHPHVGLRLPRDLLLLSSQSKLSVKAIIVSDHTILRSSFDRKMKIEIFNTQPSYWNFIHRDNPEIHIIRRTVAPSISRIVLPYTHLQAGDYSGNGTGLLLANVSISIAHRSPIQSCYIFSIRTVILGLIFEPLHTVIFFYEIASPANSMICARGSNVSYQMQVAYGGS